MNPSKSILLLSKRRFLASESSLLVSSPIIVDARMLPKSLFDVCASEFETND